MPKFLPIKLVTILLLAAATITDLRAWDGFAKTLAKNCYVLEPTNLKPVPDDAFKDTRLYVVYYSHRHCGLCIPLTKKLNAWFEINKPRREVSLVFATRLENNNEELVAYLKKSAIKFPALDTKHFNSYRNRKDATEVLHPFYADSDDGVPRFRFFHADGSEVDPQRHGVSNPYQIDPAELDKIIASMLREGDGVNASPATDGTTPPVAASAKLGNPVRLDGPYDISGIPEDLTRPDTLSDKSGPGKVFMDQIANRKFFPNGHPTSPNVLQGHAVYLPTNWEAGKKYPVIFEYLGNGVGVQSLRGIGYGLAGGNDFIWVILPIVSAYPATQSDVAVNWGNGNAISNTVEYAKQAVKEVCEKWGGDSNNCVLVGYSRGGVACNLLGLYDDEIASLWKAMVVGSHYFGTGMDITGTKIALNGRDYKVVAQENIRRLGKISQLYVAEYNRDILSGDPDKEMIPKIDAAGCKTFREAMTLLELRPVYDSSCLKNREFIEKYKPANSSVTFYPLPWVNHGSIFSLRNTPERNFIRTWIREKVGLVSSNATLESSTPATTQTSAKAGNPDDEDRADYYGYMELKDKIWEAIRTKNAELLITNMAIATEFESPEVRQRLRPQIEALLQNDIFDLEILEIPRKDRTEIAKIQSAGVYGLPQLRYCLPPQKMLEIRYRYKSSETPSTKGSQGQRFLIGKDGEEWKIITLGGKLT